LKLETEILLNTTNSINTDTFNKRKEIQQAIDFFKKKGLTQAQISGIIGNLLLESGLEPSRVNSIGAIGIAQWLGDRKSKLLRNPDYLTYNRQLAFIGAELQTTESKALTELRKQTTSQGAAVSWERWYERSGGEGLSKRIAYANDIFNKIQSGNYYY
jgi:hypothetical protein